MIEQALEEIGLTKNEIKAYLALLELGETTTGKILEKANLNSGKIYEILHSLQTKGLVSTITRDKKKHFSPANPDKILDYLSEKKQELKTKEEAIISILPELKKRTDFTKPKTKIEIYTGIEGLKTAYAKELKYKKGEELIIMGVAGLERYNKKIVHHFLHNHMPKRALKNYKIRKILDEQARKDRDIHDKTAIIKYLPYPTTMSYDVIGNLAIIGLARDDPLIITIEDEEIATSLKHQFELLWKIAKS